MSLISPGELAAIQSVAASGMISSCSILTRATVETDDGQESVWATSATGVQCWIKQITGDSSTLGAISGAVGISQVFNVRVPIGTAVSSGDQIGVTGAIYTVESSNASDTYPAWLECACRAIE